MLFTSGSHHKENFASLRHEDQPLQPYSLLKEVVELRPGVAPRLPRPTASPTRPSGAHEERHAKHAHEPRHPLEAHLEAAPLVGIAQGREHELLRDRHPRLDHRSVQPEALRLPLQGHQHVVVLRALEGIRQRLVGVVDLPDLLLRRLAG